MVAGITTAEYPIYTAVVLAAGRYPSFNDVPPSPIGLLPYFLFYDAMTPDVYARNGRVLLSDFGGAVLVTCIAVTVMGIVHGPLVYAGWKLRRR